MVGFKKNSYLAVVCMSRCMHHAEKGLRVACSMLRKPARDTLCPRPVFADDITCKIMDARETLLVEKMTVGEQFSTVHVHTTERHAVTACSHYQAGFVLGPFRWDTSSVIASCSPCRDATAIAGLKKMMERGLIPSRDNSGMHSILKIVSIQLSF